MKLKIRTTVDNSMKNVFDGFTEDLFIKLSPPFPKVKVLKFDGSEVGDEVHLEIDFLFFKQKWVSIIVESGDSDHEIYFVDEGEEMPFFMKYWRHKHRVLAKKKQSIIEDDITFNTSSIIGDVLFFPALLLQFLYRIPVYKNYFKVIPKDDN